MKFGKLVQDFLKELNQKDTVSINCSIDIGESSLLRIQNTHLIIDKSKNIWFESSDPFIFSHILKIYSDKNKKKILADTKKPFTQVELVKRLDVTQTSGYRNLSQLIDEQFLVHIGYLEKDKNEDTQKRIELYDYLFSYVSIYLGYDDSVVKLMINPNMIKRIKTDNSLFIRKTNNNIEKYV